MAASQPKSSKSTRLSFSQQLQELEQIIERFETEDIELEASVAAFERGLALLENLKRQLDNTETKVETIKKKFSHS